ncbi:transposase [Pleomorphochaeta sp. DL1XJH-081]|uniref:transposase n=1 Tax=Pleomorphochaeta sp. DL1XJH-081 TaxID=3409690 RepID=UPI003BB6215C
MPRRIGLDEIGSIHHITQRGNNRNRIFLHPHDKECFIRILKSHVEGMGIILLHYVVMDNHYHLLVEVSSVALDRFMMRLNRAYTWYYNKRYRRTGTIYEDRYHNFVVRGMSYYKAVVRYIVQNPVKANLVENPGNYLWGAHAAISRNLPTCIAREKMLSYFSDNPEEALSRYFSCCESDIHKDVGENEALQEIGVDSDDVSLVMGIFPTIDQPIDNPEHLWDIFQSVIASSDWVLRKAMRYDRVVDALLIGKTGNKIKVIFKPLRDQFILLANYEGHSNSDIAAFLGIHYETVRRIIRNS